MHLFFNIKIMSVSNKITTLKEIGEFGLIEKLTKDVKIQHKSTIKGIGDDAAVLNHKDNIVVTTDLLVEGIHFDLVYTPIKHLGYKAVVVNLSDIYAMNATPKQITVSIAMSGKFSLEAVETLYEGINLACKNYNVDLVGGDTTSSVNGLTISITAIGDIKKDKSVYRNTANVGDYICVSGDLGASYAGLQILKREKEVFMVNPNSQPDMTSYDYILERQLKPEARKDIIEAFNKNNIIPTAMIDVSDGLSSEILHICKSSNCGAKIEEPKIPIDTQTINVAEEFDIDPTIFAMNGGEDYELLFTISEKDIEKISNISDISIIGKIVDAKEGVRLYAKTSGSAEITAQGWNSYTDK